MIRRFQKRLFIKLPDEDARIQLLTNEFKDIYSEGNIYTEQELKKISKFCKKQSCSEIVENINSALVIHAIRDKNDSKMTVNELKNAFKSKASPSLVSSSRLKNFAKKYVRY